MSNAPPGFTNIRPRQFNPNPMQQFQGQRYGGLSRDSDRMPGYETPPPGIPKLPMNAPYKIPDNRDFQHPRKAPGYERSNTNPSILVSPPESTTDSESSDGPTVAPINAPVNPMNEKKFMAMKAMYHARIGSGPRVPTSEWSGCGFSKTHTSLFPVKEKLDLTTVSQDDAGESGTEEIASSSNSTPRGTWPNSGEQNDPNNNRVKQNEIMTTVVAPPKTPLGPQQSNLLDCTTSSFHLAELLNDLPTLLIQNGLEKYIDRFIAEEIDLACFSTLTEDDLRSLGVTSYPARKKMLLIITQMASRWN